MNPHSLPLRSACDRCRSHKLRCSGQSKEDGCARCLKSGVQCVFSPSMRGFRPSSDIRQRSKPQLDPLPCDAMTEGKDVEACASDLQIAAPTQTNDSFDGTYFLRNMTLFSV